MVRAKLEKNKGTSKSLAVIGRLLVSFMLIGLVMFFFSLRMISNKTGGIGASGLQEGQHSTLLRMAQSLQDPRTTATTMVSTSLTQAAAQLTSSTMSTTTSTLHDDYHLHNSNNLDGVQTPFMHQQMMDSCPESLRLNLPLSMAQPEFIDKVFDGLEQTQVHGDPLDYVMVNFDTLVKERGALSSGFWAEFGVFQGKTLVKAYRELVQKKTLFQGIIAGFDSFQGLPEKWRSYQQGFFSTNFDKVRKSVPKDVVLKVGWFQNTIGEFLEEHPRLAATLINHDGDLFVSTAITFALAGQRIVSGTIMCCKYVMGCVFLQMLNFACARCS